MATAAHAQTDAVWIGGTSTEWTDAPNWTSDPTVPDGTATFVDTVNVTVNISMPVNIGAILFDSDAQTYTITNNDTFTVTGAGVTNTSANPQDFVVNAPLTFQSGTASGGATPVRYFNNWDMIFIGFSTAGNAQIINCACGILSFTDDSNAGSATIENNNTVQFGNNSSAANATITNFGFLNFVDAAKAGSATIINDGGFVSFANTASAENATIDNKNFGGVQFLLNATAGNATITNTNASLLFADTSKAGTATIINNANSLTVFGLLGTDAPSAENANITNNNGGVTQFGGFATADNATITTNNGGQTLFFDNSTGGNAQFVTSAGGLVDFGASTGPLNDGRITAGSIAGAGTYFIGAGNTLVVGSNNLSTEVSGVIADFNPCGCGPVAGSGTLEKVGTGTLVLSGIDTYTGGTTILGGVLQLGNGGTTGSILGNVLNNATLAFNRSDTFTFSGVISGTGLVQQNGPGTTVFTAANTYTGGTVINAGTLQLGPVGSLAPTGALTVNAGGTFDLNGRTQTVGDLSGAGNILLGAGALTAGTTTSTVFSGVMSGTGAFTKTGSGVLVLTGDNTYTGGTTILPFGTLQLGNGGTTGSIVGNVLNNWLLSINRSDTFTFGSVISGTGGFAQNGPGTTILTAANTYTGPTLVFAGALLVNGSISTGTQVFDGGTLGGTGTTGPVVIDAGGTLSPGNSIGTITVNGNLTFLGAGNYLVEVSPATADRTNVTGTASLAGTVSAVFQPGSYVARTYTILSAAGGLNGTTFNTLNTTSLPGLLTASLSYTTTDVILNLTAALPPPTPTPNLTGLNINQTNAGTVLVNAFNTNGGIGGPLGVLFTLPAASVPNALSQASGELVTGAPTAGFKVMDQFLTLMIDPFLETRLGDGTTTGRALSLAPQSPVQAAMPALMAYGPMVTKAPPRGMPDRLWTMWGAAYGAQGYFNGDATIGSHKLDLRAGGFAGGIDYRVSRDTVIGVAVTGAATNWTLAGLAGDGRADTVQGGVYASTRFDNAYVSASFAYGRHDVSTDRTVAFPGVFDKLNGHFEADHFGGRLEAGYRFALTQGLGITPYGAVQVQSYHRPGYAERDLTGLTGFALNYAASTTTDTRTELGARVDSRHALDNGALLILRGRAAWVHDFDPDRSAFASFQALPGAPGFSVTGASTAPNAALVSAGAELRLRNGVSLIAKFDGEFASRAQVYGGTGTLRVSW